MQKCSNNVTYSSRPPPPLQLALNRESLMFQMLRDTQGLYAPLQLQMERQIVSKVRNQGYS